MTIWNRRRLRFLRKLNLLSPLPQENDNNADLEYAPAQTNTEVFCFMIQNRPSITHPFNDRRFDKRIVFIELMCKCAILPCVTPTFYKNDFQLYVVFFNGNENKRAAENLLNTLMKRMSRYRILVMRPYSLENGELQILELKSGQVRLELNKASTSVDDSGMATSSFEATNKTNSTELTFPEETYQSEDGISSGEENVYPVSTSQNYQLSNMTPPKKAVSFRVEDPDSSSSSGFSSESFDSTVLVYQKKFAGMVKNENSPTQSYKPQYVTVVRRMKQKESSTNSGTSETSILVNKDLLVKPSEKESVDDDGEQSSTSYIHLKSEKERDEGVEFSPGASPTILHQRDTVGMAKDEFTGTYHPQKLTIARKVKKHSSSSSTSTPETDKSAKKSLIRSSTNSSSEPEKSYKSFIKSALASRMPATATKTLSDKVSASASESTESTLETIVTEKSSAKPTIKVSTKPKKSFSIFSSKSSKSSAPPTKPPKKKAVKRKNDDTSSDSPSLSIKSKTSQKSKSLDNVSVKSSTKSSKPKSLSKYYAKLSMKSTAKPSETTSKSSVGSRMSSLKSFTKSFTKSSSKKQTKTKNKVTSKPSLESLESDSSSKMLNLPVKHVKSSSKKSESTSENVLVPMDRSESSSAVLKLPVDYEKSTGDISDSSSKKICIAIDHVSPTKKESPTTSVKFTKSINEESESSSTIVRKLVKYEKSTNQISDSSSEIIRLSGEKKHVDSIASTSSSDDSTKKNSESSSNVITFPLESKKSTKVVDDLSSSSSHRKLSLNSIKEVSESSSTDDEKSEDKKSAENSVSMKIIASVKPSVTQSKKSIKESSDSSSKFIRLPNVNMKTSVKTSLSPAVSERVSDSSAKFSRKIINNKSVKSTKESSDSSSKVIRVPSIGSISTKGSITEKVVINNVDTKVKTISPSVSSKIVDIDKSVKEKFSSSTSLDIEKIVDVGKASKKRI